MLKKLRNKKTAKKIWITLAILIVPAFVLWGLGGAIRGKQEAGDVGKIFGKRISSLEYKDALDAVKIAAIMQFGDNFSEMQKYLNLESQAWDRLILVYEARKRKIKVSDNEVVELIESYPFFQRNGRFDNRLYSQLLQYLFHTQPRAFEEQTRQNLMLSELYKQLTDDITVSEEEIKEEYKKLNEELILYYIAAIPADFAKGLAPSEQEVKDYFDKNSLQFKQPLSFALDYVTLESEDKAKDASLSLNKKRGLEQVAKDLGLTVKESGLFTQTEPIPGIGWSPEILNLILKLEVGELSQPIHSDKYYYILRLKERKESYIPDFEKIKDKVKEAFLKDKSTELAKLKIEDCHSSADFEKCAKEYGLKSDSTKPFKFGSYIEGIGASDNFWLAAQKLKEDEFSEIIAIPSGFYIIKLKSRIPVDEKKFADEKAEFRQKILSQKKQEYFAKFIEELKRNAQ